MRRLALALALAISTGPAAALDWVSANGPLTDRDFYRLVSCGAKPGGPCREALVKWPAKKVGDLTISIYRVAEGYPRRLSRSASAALDATVAEINRAGSAVRLRRLRDGEFADIRVFLLDLREGDTITGTGLRPLDGETIEAARVQVWWNGRRQIVDAAVVFASDVNRADIRSIMLEETTQALGFLTDIRDPWYNSRSVFSEDSNSVTSLGEQDMMVLRRHYPPGN
ncbi:DUF2927 domain-containing protein [Ostreiculturibacter nitratireducens]|uniref:DUF2927 domain-containing protein n=1 Tax=Ostreiculturibacter nitratireducens TaxID=3075226 RepID=UPI0031B5FBCE